MPEDVIRKGSCHCGAVRFTARFPDSALHGARCNCSICAIKGAVQAYVPLEALEVTAGEDKLSCYQFNTKVAKHWFCSHCGIHCFHQARSDPDKYGINVACLEGVSPFDFTDVPVYDGVHHAKDHGGVRRMAGRLHFMPSPDEDWREDHG